MGILVSSLFWVMQDLYHEPPVVATAKVNAQPRKPLRPPNTPKGEAAKGLGVEGLGFRGFGV